MLGLCWAKVAVGHGNERIGRLYARVLLQSESSGCWLLSLCHSAPPAERCPPSVAGSPHSAVPTLLLLPGTCCQVQQTPA